MIFSTLTPLMSMEEMIAIKIIANTVKRNNKISGLASFWRSVFFGGPPFFATPFAPFGAPLKN
jgi:hypothetical protein